MSCRTVVLLCCKCVPLTVDLLVDSFCTSPVLTAFNLAICI